MAATFEERLDELVACACSAGSLGADAVRAEHKAHGARDPRLSRLAREARKEATIAERLLSGTRARFLANRNLP